jgi:hypothetical protein
MLSHGLLLFHPHSLLFTHPLILCYIVPSSCQHPDINHKWFPWASSFRSSRVCNDYFEKSSLQIKTRSPLKDRCLWNVLVLLTFIPSYHHQNIWTTLASDASIAIPSVEDWMCHNSYAMYTLHNSTLSSAHVIICVLNCQSFISFVFTSSDQRSTVFFSMCFCAFYDCGSLKFVMLLNFSTKDSESCSSTKEERLMLVISFLFASSFC